MPLNNPPVVTLYTSGQYTGDNGVDRAIPHGLRAVPKLVVIICDPTSPHYCGFVSDTYNIELYGAPGTIQLVTGWDGVNFYVSATTVNFNDTGKVYNWVAFA